jgi:hypothetical protein
MHVGGTVIVGVNHDTKSVESINRWHSIKPKRFGCTFFSVGKTVPPERAGTVLGLPHERVMPHVTKTATKGFVLESAWQLGNEHDHGLAVFFLKQP